MNIINTELKCKIANSDSIDKFYSDLKFQNKNEHNKFTNILKIEISNKTNQKQLFFLNSLNLYDIYNIDIIIEDEEENVLKQSQPINEPFFNCKLGSLIEYDDYIKDEKQRILKQMGYNIRSSIQNYMGQDILIYPNETYVMYASISLPFVIEDVEEKLRRPFFYRFNAQKKYTFKLRYKLKEDIESVLPKDVYSNLRENNIEIFRGEIETQRVPIIFE